jgi:transposase
MGAKTSPQVIEAVEMVRNGMSAYAAAKHVGIALSTIYRSALYKAFRDEKAEKK